MSQNNLSRFLTGQASPREIREFEVQANTLNRQGDIKLVERKFGKRIAKQVNDARYDELFGRFQQFTNIDPKSIKTKADLENFTYDALDNLYNGVDSAARRAHARSLSNSFAQTEVQQQLFNDRRQEERREQAARERRVVAKRARIIRLMKNDVNRLPEDIGRDLSSFERNAIRRGQATQVGDDVIVRVQQDGRILYRNRGRFSRSPSALARLRGLL